MKINSRVQVVDLMRSFDLPLVAAEIGVAEGRWSRQLMQLGMETLYCVDIWENVPFIEGCAGHPQEWHDQNFQTVVGIKNDYPDKVVMLKGFSYKMAGVLLDESLGMVYIDGDHTYRGARTDIDYFWPKLVPGGIMLFHDAANKAYGIMEAMWDFTKGVGINELIEDGKIENMGAWIQKS